jgi:hypothetical protein
MSFCMTTSLVTQDLVLADYRRAHQLRVNKKIEE